MMNKGPRPASLFLDASRFGRREKGQQLLARDVDAAVRRSFKNCRPIESLAAVDVGCLPFLALIVANDPRAQVTLGFFLTNASLLICLNERSLSVGHGIG